MKRLLATVPLLAAIAVASYSAVNQSALTGHVSQPAAAEAIVPAQMLPQSHPSVEPWLQALPEGHPPVLLPRNPHLPEGHPPIPGYAGACPGFRGEAGGNTDEPTVDAQELIST